MPERQPRRPPAPLLVVVRHALLGDKALVSSRSQPGDWHVIDAEGHCDCVAHARFGRLCSHVKALRERVEELHAGQGEHHGVV